jgi:hypothetical protein
VLAALLIKMNPDESWFKLFLFWAPPLTDCYRGLQASLLTQHGKEAVICPELLHSAGLEVSHVTGFDTDTLGTFTREVDRRGHQLDAARAKARMGMERSGLPIGIASEGAFDADPYLGILPWNYELLILIDDTRQIEVTGLATGQAQSAHRLVSSWDELVAFSVAAQFPSHHLVVRPDSEHHPDMRKGIHTLESLQEAYHWACAMSTDGQVFVENDLRAHTNPSRMAMILKATQDLSLKLASQCPQCAAPGFWLTGTVKGLPCAACRSPTPLAIAHIWSCRACALTLQKPIADAFAADPMRCNHCNP